MNSIEDLNGLGSITFTDERQPRPIFDRSIAWNKTVNINQNDDHNVPEGINILDVIRPTDALVSYTITINDHPGATVTWPTVPAGCITYSTAPNSFSIAGINSAAIWEQVKNPDFNPDPYFIGVFSYTASIEWHPTPSTVESKSWTVSVVINDITNMSVPEDVYFLYGDSGTVAGNPEIIDNYSTTWTVTVVPSSLSAVDVIGSAGSGGTTSYNATTKTLTINGSKTQVNSHLNSLTYELPTTSRTDFTLIYLAINDTTNEGDTKIQQWYSTEFLSATRDDDSYTLNTAANITNGPLITDAESNGRGQYTMTIVPTDLDAVSEMTSTGRYDWTLNQTINNPNPKYAGEFFPSSWAISADEQYLVLANSSYRTNVSPAIQPGAVYVYTRSGSSWVQQALVMPSSWNSATPYFGSSVAISSDGSTLAVSAYYEDASASPATNSADYRCGAIYVFTRTGSTWTQQTKLVSSSRGNQDKLAQTPGRLSISSDGNRICASTPRITYPSAQAGVVFHWTRSGSTWTERSVITSPYANDSSQFGSNVKINANSTYLTVSDPYYVTGTTAAGAVHVYTLSSTSATIQQTIVPSDYTSTSRFGFVGLDISDDGASLAFNAAGSSPGTYIWTRISTTWTQSQKISSSVSGICNFTSDKVYLLAGDKVYNLVSGSYSEFSDSISNGSLLSALGTYILTINQLTTVSGFIWSGTAYVYAVGIVGTSWDDDTKTLTLSGNRNQVNADIDTIVLTPASGYDTDIVLTYTLTTPGFNTDDRIQTITYTP